jgi:hypothetical protein
MRRPENEWGFWGLALYIFVWALTYFNISKIPGHWVSSFPYENKYPYIFARELVREGNCFLFRNPFGSLDSAPRLWNFYASILRLLYPLWAHDWFFFDHVLGGIFSFFLFRELRKFFPHPRVGWLAGLVFVGGSLTILPYWLSLSAWGKIMDFALLPWAILFPATNWILFEALLLRMIRKLMARRFRSAALLSLFLALFHNLFGAVSLLAFVCFLSVEDKKIVKNRDFQRACAIIAITIFYLGVVCLWLWPRWSLDAAYFRFIYADTSATGMFEVPFLIFLSCLAGPLFFLARVPNPARARSFVQDRPLWIFFVALTVVTLLPILGFRFLPQASRWGLALPYWLPLILVGRMPSSSKYQQSLLFRAGVLFCMADGLFSLCAASRLPRIFTRDTFVVSDFKWQVLSRLRSRTPGLFLYFRPCHDPERVDGDFEYLVMAETEHQALISHTYFTPALIAKSQALRHCGPDFENVMDRVVEPASTVLAERSLAARLRSRGFEEVLSDPRSDLSFFEKNIR